MAHRCAQRMKRPKPLAGIELCNKGMLWCGTELLHQQISHQTPNITLALWTMKTWIIFFSPSSSLLFIFLTVEPCDADGFNKHSKENWCSCCKVVQQSEHIHPTLGRQRRKGNMCFCLYMQTFIIQFTDRTDRNYLDYSTPGLRWGKITPIKPVFSLSMMYYRYSNTAKTTHMQISRNCLFSLG